ncbi:MAG: hypothetical protein U1D55_12425 [Phycisphaerae bacterium]
MCRKFSRAERASRAPKSPDDRRTGVRTGIAALLLSLAVAQAAFSDDRLANLYLTDGSRLRGRVEEVDDAVILRNAAGEMRLERTRVERIEWLTPEESDAAEMPASEPASRPSGQQLAAPPLLSSVQINRLKLAEISTTGDVERVRARFTKRAGEPDLETAVLAELEGRPELEEARRVFRSGEISERVQFILRHTGLKFADRIEIRGDTQTFSRFRKDVLPTVLRGCGRSGCHAGPHSAAFRLPSGSTESEEFAYTAFLVLDAVRTPRGPLIDRSASQRSVLLSYLCPPREGAPEHPAVARGTHITPALRGVADPRHQALADWIASLRTPRPAYDLDYAWPEWLSLTQE